MDANFNVENFLHSVKSSNPPWECPQCKKIYKSFGGLENHLLNFDHTADMQHPTKSTRVTHKFRFKASKKKKNNQINREMISPVEFIAPARETLTWAEAQKMVEVEADGKIYRLNICEKLDIIPDSDISNDVRCSSRTSSSDFTSSCLSDSNLNISAVGNKSINSEDLRSVTLPMAQFANENHTVTSGSPSTLAMSKLPKPSFRLLPEYKKKVVKFSIQSTYYKYIEKSTEELEKEVEYDMDEEDARWLQLINENRSKEGLAHVSDDQMEFLMDRFEKEACHELARSRTADQNTEAQKDEDAVCCVCDDGESLSPNVIMFCDMCNVAVHQECYGVAHIPKGQWLCRRCIKSPSKLVDCCLCPSQSGAFKQTDDGRWAHVICAIWIPEVGFADDVRLEPVDDLHKIPPARWKLTCFLCKLKNNGACIQCHKSNCYTAFHVTCAQQAGLCMKMKAVKESGKYGMTVTVLKEAYCYSHTPPDAPPNPQRSNGQFVINTKEVNTIEKTRKSQKGTSDKQQDSSPTTKPYFPLEKVTSIARPLSIEKKNTFLQRLLCYWTLKRQSRNDSPLLRRLQSHVHTSKPNDPEAKSQQHRLIEQLKYWHRLRHDLERARLLIELIRKREKLKKESIRMSQVFSEVQLTPFIILLRRVLKKLRDFDERKIFAEPVKRREALDYYKLIEHPMDFSTMSTKVESHKYRNVDDFEHDFNLVIQNCLFYNDDDSTYYKLGVRMREYGGALLREAKREVKRCGFDTETGLLLKKRPEQKAIDVFDERSRLKLPLQQQLDVLHERLDKAIINLRKTRKIMLDISTVNRKIFEEERQKALTGTEPFGSGRSMTRRRLSADDVFEPASISQPEAASPDHDSAFVSPEMRRKQPSARRKRLSSAQPSLSNLSEPKRKKKLSETSEGLSTSDNTFSADNVAVCQRSSPIECCEVSDIKGRNISVENSSNDSFEFPIKRLEKYNFSAPPIPANINGSVNRRTSILFNKKKHRNKKLIPPPLALSMPPEPATKIQRAFSLSGSNKPSSRVIKRTRSMSREYTWEDDKTRIMEDIAEETVDSNENLVNGFDTIPEETVFEEKPCPGSGESLQSSEKVNIVEENSSNSTKTSLSGRNSNSSDVSSGSPIQMKKSPKKARSHSFSVGYINNNSYQSDGTCSGYSSEDQPGIFADFAGSRGDFFRQHSCVSAPEDEFEENDFPIIKPLDLVWAKCLGYPPYPALLIDPKMPRSGFCHNGVPIPVPPLDVLQVGDKRIQNGNRRIYLVLFFDAKRTWQWLPRNKLERLGVDLNSDQSKLSEGRRPAVRKNVEAAYNRAMSHLTRVMSEDSESDDEAQ